MTARYLVECEDCGYDEPAETLHEAKGLAATHAFETQPGGHDVDYRVVAADA